MGEGYGCSNFISPGSQPLQLQLNSYTVACLCSLVGHQINDDSIDGWRKDTVHTVESPCT